MIGRSRASRSAARVMSGHSELLRSYTYRPDAPPDTKCVICDCEDTIAHMLIDCDDPRRRDFRPAWVNRDKSLAQFVASKERCEELIHYCKRMERWTLNINNSNNNYYNHDDHNYDDHNYYHNHDYYNHDDHNYDDHNYHDYDGHNFYDHDYYDHDDHDYYNHDLKLVDFP
ncbi:hypothetical protein FOZ60_005474 [Perkinsus olseni]|uniref:Uncharacterized protein n=1 Tax=Perkinsus olseni TaxID=32597 RepID=A0A7J6NR02_PEROL|nr:hypothetical protein FOZ60_005474 [Perkinsus olseni]